jgi:hypothetical protein
MGIQSDAVCLTQGASKFDHRAVSYMIVSYSSAISSGPTLPPKVKWHSFVREAHQLIWRLKGVQGEDQDSPVPTAQSSHRRTTVRAARFARFLRPALCSHRGQPGFGTLSGSLSGRKRIKPLLQASCLQLAEEAYCSIDVIHLIRRLRATFPSRGRLFCP